MSAMSGSDGPSFKSWARTTVQLAGEGLVEALADRAVPAKLGGEGGPRSTGVGYRSQYVTLATSFLGPLALWLYAVPAEHEYGTNPRRPQLGAGLMRDSDTILEQPALAFGRLGVGNPFRWRKLKGDWEGYVLLLDADPLMTDSERAGEQLADAVLRGLGAAGLDR
jgi:hypothetical protein